MRRWTLHDDTVPGSVAASVRELDARTSGGTHIRLLWRQADGRVLVDVKDAGTGEAFSVEVPEGRRALDVFQHPFVYAK